MAAIVAILVLTILFFGAIVWMEIHSWKTSSNERPRDSKRSESNEKHNSISETGSNTFASK